MSTDGFGLLALGAHTLGLSELLDESHGLSLETSGEPPAGSAVDELGELSRGHVQKFVQINTSVGELLEGTLPLDLDFFGHFVCLWS